MISNQNRIVLLIFPLCGWIGLGVTQIWGGTGLLLMLLLGGGWAWGSRQHRQWLTNLCFLILVLICIRGLLKNTGEVYFVSGIMGALAVWDLERFFNRLQVYEQIHNKSMLLRQHLWRLGVVFVFSFILYWIAFQIELELKFWVAILLISTILIGGNWAFRLFKPPSSLQGESFKKK